MKPIIFITRMDGGGLETFCLELLQQLKTTLHFTSATLNHCYATLYTSYAGGVRAQDVPNDVERVCWNVRAKKCWLRMARWLRTRTEDPCLCLNQELCVVLVLLRRLHLIHNRIFFHESTDVEHHYDATYWRMMRHILPYCDGLVEQSWSGLEATKRLCGCELPRAIVIRNMMGAENSARQQLRHSANRNIIYPASFKPMKGQEWLVRNAAEVLGKENDWRMTFFGDGKRREACERLVKERGLEEKFRFENWTADKDAMYANADCVVIPSDYEGLPNVMLEAVLRGIRVSVRPTCTGACELLREIGIAETWPLSVAFSIPDEMWHAARERLSTLCDPKRVTEQILEFMSESAACRAKQEALYKVRVWNNAM